MILDYYTINLASALAFDDLDTLESLIRDEFELLRYVHSESAHARVIANLTHSNTENAIRKICDSFGVRSSILVRSIEGDCVEVFRDGVRRLAKKARASGLVVPDDKPRAEGGGAKLKGKLYTKQRTLGLVGGRNGGDE